jgi:lysophospholipase L1-like esterase
MNHMKPGSRLLYDNATGNVVGYKDLDGDDQSFLTMSAAGLALAGNSLTPSQAAQVRAGMGAASGEGATPQELGAAFWLNAGSITGLADGATVVTWPDASGNGISATPIGSPAYYARAANGKPAVYLSGSTQAFSFTERASVRTIAMVFWLDDVQVNDYGAILGHSTIASDFHGPLKSLPYLVDGGTIGAVKRLSRVSINGRLVSGELGAMLKPTAPVVMIVRVPSGATMTFDRLGSDRNTAGRYPNGYFSEVAMWDRELTDGEVAALSEHFCKKYQIRPESPYVSSARANGIFIGDSITLGQGATLSYPAQLATTIGTSRLSVWNIGIGGSTAEQWANTQFGTQVFSVNQVRVQPTRQVVHVFLGTNDLFFNRTAAQAFESLKRDWAMSRALGASVIAYTILPRSNAGTPAGFETARQALNTLIRGTPWMYDYLVDVGADSTIGVAGASTNATYYQADQVHPTNAGLEIIANLSVPAYAALKL